MFGECVKILLDHNADVNHADAAGETPLMIAINSDLNNIVTEILAHNPAINAVNNEGKTAIYYTINNKLSLLNKLLEHEEQPVDLSRRYENGVTLLHIAVEKNNESIVSLLLEKGLEPDALDDFGNTPLHIAAQNKARQEIIQKLVRAGCDPAQSNKKGRTVFSVATPDTARLLAETMNEQESIEAREERKEYNRQLESEEINKRIEARDAKYTHSGNSSDSKSKSPIKRSTLRAMTKGNGTLKQLPPAWQKKLSSTSPTKKNIPRPWGGTKETAKFQRDIRIMIRKMKASVLQELNELKDSVEEVRRSVQGDDIGFEGFSSSANNSASGSQLIPIPQNLEENHDSSYNNDNENKIENENYNENSNENYNENYNQNNNENEEVQIENQPDEYQEQSPVEETHNDEEPSFNFNDSQNDDEVPANEDPSIDFGDNSINEFINQ